MGNIGDANCYSLQSSADAHEYFPLTEIQYAYWVGRGPNFVLGNVAPHAYFELEGKRLDPALLARTWLRLIDRHGTLRAVVREDGRQRVLRELPSFEIGFEDLSQAGHHERQDRLAATRAAMSERVYDPARWPLFDLKITRLAAHDRLHVSFDLLMFDLASIAQLFSEWSTLCRNEAAVLPPVDVTFRDYVMALERATGTPRYKRSLDYWISRAEELAPPPEIPLAKAPAQIHKPGFSHREYQLPHQEWSRFQDLARDRGLTATAVLASVFATILRTWSGTPRFTLNLTLFNRLPLLLHRDESGRQMVHPHLRHVVGDFTSICLLEMDTTGDLSLAESAARTQAQLQADLRHRSVSALQTLRERRRRGLQTGFEGMPVVFTSGLGTVSGVADSMDYFGDITYRLSQTPQVWLDHQVLDLTGSLDLTWDAVEELFPDGLLDDMFASYCAAVQRLSNPEAWDRSLDVLVPEHQLAERHNANDTAGPVPAGLLHDGLLKGALAHPDRPAVLNGSGATSYGRLAEQAAGVATDITRLAGGRPAKDRLVAVTLPKGPSQVAAVYGVLLASAAYLPVDPALPTRRRHALYEDGEVLAVVTDHALDTRLDWPEALPRLYVDDVSRFCRDGGGTASATDLAYVLYTSGSTGHPKGVMIEHRSALNTITDINERFGVGPADRIFGLAELGFDLSVYDLFGSTAAGCALVLPGEDERSEPSRWAALMAKHHVTVWNSVPAQMLMLVEHLEAAPEGSLPEGLRLVLLSGDWIPLDLPGRIIDLWPEAAVIGLGGATEASIWSNWHPASDVPEGAPSVPYGKPLRNQAFHVLDPDMRPCPVWVPGELYIEGIGLARGYWHDPERTAQSFVRHRATGTRLYRTGDFGRYLPDGVLQFLGRRDGQVKIGGYRIECGEVEAVLSGHPAVQSAVVVKSVGQEPSARLLGFVVPDRSDSSLTRIETIDAADAARSWDALCTAAKFPAPGPGPADLRSAWTALDTLHAAATASAFGALGFGRQAGDRFDPAAALSDGVAPRYERWLRRAAVALRNYGLLRAGAGGLEVARPFPETIPGPVTERARQVLRAVLQVPDDLADWMMALVGGLADILTLSTHSAALYASDHTPEIYASLFGPTYEVASQAVRGLAAAWTPDRPLRVLEVGAGYGTLTANLLPLLPADRTEYLFTDISTYFTNRAAEVFGEFGFVRQGLFNLDQSPELQGYEGLAVDLVIAASVLHDIRKVGAGLGALRSVLAPGGSLLIVEQTAFSPWFDLTMGLQQGFDGYEDTELRSEGHPLLDLNQWSALLADAGFAETAVLTRDGDGPAAVGFDVIAARGPLTQHRFEREALRDYAAACLPRHMVPAQLYALDRLPLSRTGKVDRAALARVGACRAGGTRTVRPPTTDRQVKLVEIYRSVLGLGQVDLADDFLEAGGDSLLAARIAAELHRALGVEVPVGVVLQQPTIAGLDAWLEPVLGSANPLNDLLSRQANA